MNILDYLAWRGDLSFSQDGFNHVDNLVLSYLSYIKYDGLVRENEAISIQEINRVYFIHHSEKDIEHSSSFISLAPLVLKACANCNRFKNTKIANYVSKMDKKQDLQFCGVEFILDNNTSYIAFRGTDDTMVGWKEDFMTSYCLTQAQIEAVAYLNKYLDTNKRYIVGGHSKGGLLAYYAASKMAKEQQDVIEHIYSNDGPGIVDELFDYQEFSNIKDKYIKIVPEFSIVGQLFNHQNDMIVIKSKAANIMQHDGMRWQVLGNNFVCCQSLDKTALVVLKIVNEFLSNASDEERKIFTNGIFNALDGAGVKNTTDFAQGGLTLIIKVIKELGEVDSSVKQVSNKLLKALSNEANIQAKGLIGKMNPFKDKKKVAD